LTLNAKIILFKGSFVASASIISLFDTFPISAFLIFITFSLDSLINASREPIVSAFIILSVNWISNKIRWGYITKRLAVAVYCLIESNSNHS